MGIDEFQETLYQSREGVATELGAGDARQATEGGRGVLDVGCVTGYVKDAVGEHVAKIGGHEGEVGALRVGKERTEVGGMHQLIEGSGGGGLEEG